LLQGTVAVVTGFIGATVDGALTTLGRNSSDFSGTIVGAAIDADEVTLWTDVDGILTADPKVVRDARPIPQMSYSEASDLGKLGSKVLHPKTVRPLRLRGIPLSIRNTFAPHLPGTKITATGPCDAPEVKALAASADAGLITIRGGREDQAERVLRRALSAVEKAHIEFRLIAHSPSTWSELCVVVSSALLDAAAGALRGEFAQDLADGKLERIDLDPSVGVIAIVGESPLGMRELALRVVSSLQKEKLRVAASTEETSQPTFSIVVAREHLKEALVCAHRELALHEVRTPEIS
jgi:aspartate kinase